MRLDDHLGLEALTFCVLKAQAVSPRHQVEPDRILTGEDTVEKQSCSNYRSGNLSPQRVAAGTMARGDSSAKCSLVTGKAEHAHATTSSRANDVASLINDIDGFLHGPPTELGAHQRLTVMVAALLLRVGSRWRGIGLTRPRPGSADWIA